MKLPVQIDNPVITANAIVEEWTGALYRVLAEENGHQVTMTYEDGLKHVVSQTYFNNILHSRISIN